MRILLTGASGFVGRWVAARLAAGPGATLVAAVRDPAGLSRFDWADGVERIALDLDAPGADFFDRAGRPDCVIHAAWPGLPDFRSPLHLDAVGTHFAFLKSLLEAGLPRLVVLGTCLEYGMRSGPLAETLDPAPALSYPVGKDALRRLLEPAAARMGATLLWLRLFYVHGPGQTPKSLLPLLDAAIDRGEAEFPMSGGEQLRDFLPIETAAGHIAALAAHPDAAGVYNIGSGRPTSVRRLVEERIAARAATIRPKLGVYPYPDYEPMAFWADMSRTFGLIGK